MKKTEKSGYGKDKRVTTKCLVCGQCNTEQIAEIGVKCSNPRYEAKALYGAEVLTYYFYFVRGAALAY